MPSTLFMLCDEPDCGEHQMFSACVDDTVSGLCWENGWQAKYDEEAECHRFFCPAHGDPEKLRYR